MGDPRKGWNGGTSLAYLAVVLDFLERCQNSKFGCKENEAAISCIGSAIYFLKERIRRRHVEGTFQTHQAAAGETPTPLMQPKVGESMVSVPFARAFTLWERRYREEPAKFASDFERFTSSTNEYGDSAASYFRACFGR
jgi:hypothetical protein